MCKNKNEFDQLVVQRMKANALKKKLEAKVEALDAEISEYIKNKGTPGGKDNKTLIIYGDGYKASLIEITQYNPDREKLKAYFGDEYVQYQKPNTYSRVDIR